MRILIFILFFFIVLTSTFCQENKPTGGPGFRFYKLPGFIYLCKDTNFSDTLYLCPNDSFQLEMIDISQPHPCSHYQWKKNGINVNGATSNIYTVIDTGIYSIQVNCDWNISTLGNFIVVCIPTGIKEIESKFNLLIFPNPTEEKINIQFDNFYNTTILIYNTFGEIVLTKKLTDRISQVDISSLNNGVYYISVANGSTTSRQKIIKNAH